MSCVHSVSFSIRLVRVLLGLSLSSGACAAERAASADWTAEMGNFAQADAAAPSSAGCVLFVGSSSIRLWATVQEDFPGVPVVNRGFGGSQVTDAIVHFDRLVLPHDPRLIVFYAGTNDLAAGKRPEEVAADVAEFCARVHTERPQSRIVFVAVQYAPARWHLKAAMAAANELIAKFCAEDPRREFVDVNVLTLGATGEPREDLYSPDRLHMSAAGYALWTQALTQPINAR